MIKNKVRQFGVTDSSSTNNSQIIGIISSRDLIRLLIHKLEYIDNDVPPLMQALYWQEEPMEELNS